MGIFFRPKDKRDRADKRPAKGSLEELSWYCSTEKRGRFADLKAASCNRPSRPLYRFRMPLSFFWQFLPDKAIPISLHAICSGQSETRIVPMQARSPPSAFPFMFIQGGSRGKVWRRHTETVITKLRHISRIFWNIIKNCKLKEPPGPLLWHAMIEK